MTLATVGLAAGVGAGVAAAAGAGSSLGGAAGALGAAGLGDDEQATSNADHKSLRMRPH